MVCKVRPEVVLGIFVGVQTDFFGFSLSAEVLRVLYQRAATEF
jgi:hypothetical protein